MRIPRCARNDRTRGRGRGFLALLGMTIRADVGIGPYDGEWAADVGIGPYVGTDCHGPAGLAMTRRGNGLPHQPAGWLAMTE